MRPLPLPPCRPGINFLYGTTASGGATGTPVAEAQIALLPADMLGRTLSARSVSDEEGAFCFYGLPSSVKFAVVAFDPTGQYDPAAKNNLVPSPMPPDPSEHP